MRGKIGHFVLKEVPITIHENRATCELIVKNEGERVIQIGSHFHFFETNRDLLFDRESALGMHLDIPSGTSIRWMPGETKKVKLCEYGGTQTIYGFNGLVNGCVKEESVRKAAILKAEQLGFIRRSSP